MDMLGCILVAMICVCIMVLLYVIGSIMDAVERYIKGLVKRRKKRIRGKGGKIKWAR